MKITIPSRARASQVATTVELFEKESVLVYIRKEEEKHYAKFIEPKLIRTLPGEVFGMGAIRKYMLKQHLNEDYVLQLDDDVDGMEYKFKEKISKSVEKSHVYRIIDNCAGAAIDLGTCLFGFISSPNPMLYTQLNHFLFGGMVACGIGIVPKNLGEVMFDERFIVNEDHDFSLQTKYYKRFLLMDGRYNWSYGKTWLTDGGCSTIRNKVTLEKCRELLKKKWGNCVIPNKKKPDQIYFTCLFRENSCSIPTPFR